ncbi:unnamed protein product [Ixodes persulcatus]
MDENDVSDSRVRYTDHQLQKLEEMFSEHAFINGDQAALLSRELGISLKQTRTWFQNRRAKLRRRAIKAEGKSYVPKLSPGPIRICRTPPSPSPGTGKVALLAGPREGVLKPSNGKCDSQRLNVPSFSSRSLSDSPVLSSADEDDVFLCVPSSYAGRQRPAGKDPTAELLSKSAPTSAYMEAARRSEAAEQWQPPFPTFFGEAEASGGGQ